MNARTQAANDSVTVRGICCVCLVFLVLLWCVALAAQAADRYVVPYGTPGGTNEGPFTNWSIAATQIQWAVDAASPGETVWISNGVYVLTNQIEVNANIFIVGTGGVAVIDGNYPNTTNRCFYIPTGVTGTLENLFITRGYSEEDGGGAWVSNSVVRNCVFSNNYSMSHGGGLHTFGQVFDSQFITNTAEGRGGGLYIERESERGYIDSCLFYANTAHDGGGLYSRTYSPTLWPYAVVTNCDFIANFAINWGGGVAQYLHLTDSRVISNVAGTVSSLAQEGRGGGAYLEMGSTDNTFFNYNKAARMGGGAFGTRTSFSNCTLRGNEVFIFTTQYGGGGLYIRGGSTAGGDIYNSIIEENYTHGAGALLLNRHGTVRNCLIRNNTSLYGGGLSWSSFQATEDDPATYIINTTIVSNRATGAGTTVFDPGGGGVYIWNAALTVSFVNCVIYGNVCDHNPSTSNIFIIADAPVSFSNSCFAPALTAEVAVAWSSNNIIADPRFLAPEKNNYQLSVGSPCIDTGLNQDWMIDGVDLEGNPRIFRGTVDMGAYERFYRGLFLKTD